MRFAIGYYHWFFLIQPAPLPERMIGGDPGFYLRWTLGGWGSTRPRPHRARGARRVRALLLPRRRDPRRPARTTAPAASIDLEHDRASRAAGEKIGCDLLAALGHARPRRPPLRPARALAGAVRGPGRGQRDGGRPLHPRGAARRRPPDAPARLLPRRLGRACTLFTTPRVTAPAYHRATPEGGAPMFAWINRLDRYLPIRYAVWALCIVGFVASAGRLDGRWA